MLELTNEELIKRINDAKGIDPDLEARLSNNILRALSNNCFEWARALAEFGKHDKVMERTQIKPAYHYSRIEVSNALDYHADGDQITSAMREYKAFLKANQRKRLIFRRKEQPEEEVCPGIRTLDVRYLCGQHVLERSNSRGDYYPIEETEVVADGERVFVQRNEDPKYWIERLIPRFHCAIGLRLHRLLQDPKQVLCYIPGEWEDAIKALHWKEKDTMNKQYQAEEPERERARQKTIHHAKDDISAELRERYKL